MLSLPAIIFLVVFLFLMIIFYMQHKKEVVEKEEEEEFIPIDVSSKEELKEIIFEWDYSLCAGR